MASPLISVIVPVYKVEPWLDRCVASVLAQTFRDFELLLVDDGSPDQCGEMCESWARKDARIRVFHKPNGGVADARNFGIRQASGDFVAFVDADDFVLPDLLSYLMSLFEHAPDTQMVECSFSVRRNGNLFAHDSGGTISVLGQTEAFGRLMYDEGLYPSVCAKLFRRQLFEGLSFPVGHVFEDSWLLPDCLALTPRMVYGANPLYVYSLRGNSITTAPFDPANAQDHFNAMEHIVAAARKCGCSSEAAERRLLAFSRLRTLRQIPLRNPRHRPLARRLRAEVLADAPLLLADPRLPRRDRLGIRCLRLGLVFYRCAWNAYCLLRDLHL